MLSSDAFVFGKVCNMATMNVSLPDPMKDWVETQVRGGRYANVSDYVRDLIRRDKSAQDRKNALISALIEGEESGVSERTFEDIIEEVLDEVGAEQNNA